MKATLAFATLLAGFAVALVQARTIGATQQPTVYKLFHITPSEVGIVCKNGADPTGRKYGEMVIISCGEVRP